MTEPTPASGAEEPDWQAFHSNKDIWPAVLETCEGARHGLMLEQYILSHRGIGARLMDVLTGRLRAGVQVRLLLDAFGSRGLARSAERQAFERAGGEVRFYNGVGDFLRNPVANLHRLHRKTVVADGARLMVGGSCYLDRMADWRDTMMRVDGPLAKSASDAFEVVWARSGAARRDVTGEPPRKMETGDWAYMLSGSFPPIGRDCSDRLVEEIGRAVRSVVLTTPYFVPDRRFFKTVTDALGRGVSVKLLVPAKSDHPSIDILSHFAGRALARRGAEVFAYEPAMMHAKIALVDGDWASVGSSNLDILSFWFNLENSIVSRSRAFHDALADQLARDFSASSRL